MSKKSGLIIFISISSLLMILIFYFVIYPYFVPSIILYKGKSYVINYKSSYKDPGYKAFFRGKDLTDEVEVSGKVNTEKIGNYKILYKIDGKIFPKKVIRTVKVRDIEKPKITLKSLEDIYVCPGKKYKGEEYSAEDNYDGNITNRVKVKQKEDSIQYSVIDNSGNYSSVSRKIKYEDIEKPNITINNEKYLSVYLNEEYVEPGYKAVDNCDGNITKNVKIVGNVDTTSPGKYELTYQVSDKNKNKEEQKRIVNVVKKSQKGTIYLTFDDGPRMGITNVILDILKEEEVKATFFVTNNGPDELIRREFDEGHGIGLHTATHDYSYVYSNSKNYFDDLNIVYQRVLNITGYDTRIIRFPGGSSNTVSRKYNEGIMSYLTKEVLNRSYLYYDWNINSGDTGISKTSEEVYQNVVNNLSLDKVNVVLMHDIKTYTRDALRKIIEYGKTNGYVFEKIQNDTEMITQSVNN